MRKDMSKILTDEGRRGGNGSHPQKGYKKALQKMDYDELPIKESMRQPHQAWDHTKESELNRKAFARYLKSKIGQKWDDVYSEICKTIKVTSGKTHWAFSRLDLEVDCNVVMENGIPHDPRGYQIYGLYVHPETGLLKYREYNYNRKFKKPQPLGVKHPSKDNIQFLQQKDIWYEVELAKVEGIVYDVVLMESLFVHKARQWSDRRILEKYYGTSELYATNKRQLNSREIKKFKLRG